MTAQAKFIFRGWKGQEVLFQRDDWLTRIGLAARRHRVRLASRPPCAHGSKTHHVPRYHH